MTAQPILEALAREFAVEPTSIQAVFEMLDAGLTPVFVGRFRRAQTGTLSEHQIRRLAHMRAELEDLDRRRGTILRALERQEGVAPEALEAIRRCMDRFELEDLFVPHRRPEPEVQLAIDRGLAGLADAIVQPVPKEQRRRAEPGEDEDAAEGDAEHAGDAEQHGGRGEHAGESDGHGESPVSGEGAAGGEHAHVAEGEEEAHAADEAEAARAAAGDGAEGDGEGGAIGADASAAETDGANASASDANAADAIAGEADATGGGASDARRGAEAELGSAAAGRSAGSEPPTRIAVEDQLAMNIELAKLCRPYVDPDKGVHTDAEALAGAVRILSDRLGRSAHLRGLVRRTLRKRGTLSVRPLVDEKRAGRHKPLLRFRAPLRQLQGHKLTALRQAQKERILNTVIELELEAVLPKVRAHLGRHTRAEFEPLLREIATQALRDRLLPVVEGDVRLELKERSDHEALRFLGAHLRQILLTPAMGRRRVAGVDVNAKGDWTLAFLDENGAILADARIEVAGKDDAALTLELAPLLDAHQPEALALAHGKSSRAAVLRLRGLIHAAGRQEGVLIVNDSGASSYANGQRARAELGEHAVPVRLAVTLGRRLQDPLAEILKVDPRHLGLGAEQGLVSKANARRVFDESVESCVAHVGAELDRAPRIVLEHVPGLGKDAVDRLIARREQGPIESRETLRAEQVLSEAEWTSAIAFLRVYRSTEPLDRTGLHPEQYDLVRRMLEPAGGVSEALGRPGSTKGLRRVDYGVDEYTWRDLMRELSFPGRDPRPRVRVPELLPPDVDPIRVQPGRIVEGIVTNVASFGAFVDIGVKDDAMVHISELASRYVRDARELLSIGATVRARIVDPNGSRMALSLKDVPPPERAPRRFAGGHGGEGGGPRHGDEGRGGRGGRGHRGGHGGHERSQSPAAQIYRRDGMAGAAGGRRGFGGGPRRGGPGRGDGGRGRDDRAGRDERVDLNEINAAAKQGASHNPFASFFGKQKKDEPAAGG